MRDGGDIIAKPGNAAEEVTWRAVQHDAADVCTDKRL